MCQYGGFLSRGLNSRIVKLTNRPYLHLHTLFWCAQGYIYPVLVALKSYKQLLLMIVVVFVIIIIIFIFIIIVKFTGFLL